MQSLEEKLEYTKELIRCWYEAWGGQVYVAFSGGKDSTVLLHLVRELYPDVPAVFCNTGLEYPEVVKFVRQQENVITLRPSIPFHKVIEKYGYPVISKEQSQYISEYRTTKSEKLKVIRLNRHRGSISKKWQYLVNAPFKISDKCCDVIKKKPFKKFEKETGLNPYLGLMGDDSVRRLQNIRTQGCNAYELKRPTSKPLAWWNTSDIYRYVLENNLPISEIYGHAVCNANGIYEYTGLRQTGCMFCMFGVHLESEPNRFQRMQKTHPKQYKFCMEKLGLKEVLRYIGVPWENRQYELWEK